MFWVFCMLFVFIVFVCLFLFCFGFDNKQFEYKKTRKNDYSDAAGRMWGEPCQSPLSPFWKKIAIVAYVTVCVSCLTKHLGKYLSFEHPSAPPDFSRVLLYSFTVLLLLHIREIRLIDVLLSFPLLCPLRPHIWQGLGCFNLVFKASLLLLLFGVQEWEFVHVCAEVFMLFIVWEMGKKCVFSFIWYILHAWGSVLKWVFFPALTKSETSK